MDFLLLTKRAAMGVAASLLAIGLAACGGDDGGDEGEAPAASTPGPGSSPGTNPGANPGTNPGAITDFPPVISGTPITQVAVGTAYSFTPTAFDSNGDALAFSVVNLPSWASFNPSTGQVTGTPQTQHVGTFNFVTISVTANGRTTSLPPYSIQVVNPPPSDAPPVIGGNPASQVTAGSAYSFTPTASDPNGDALSFTVVNLPTWASFSTTTGTLSGTPLAQHVGSYSGVTISVTANGRTVSLAPFNIQVVGTPSSSNDSPPVISGFAPPQVVVGTPYSFTPTASDPNGDVLSFSVSGLPAWAQLDPTTGRVSGTPQAQHLGSSSVTITVTANGKTASLQFSVEVVAFGSESVTLTWLPPTQNEDGTALTDLAGYKIRYGQTPGSFTQTITVANPGLSSWHVDNLVKGTYYFVISAYNSSGVESRYSNVASKAL